jgi:hypothetical protein
MDKEGGHIFRTLMADLADSLGKKTSVQQSYYLKRPDSPNVNSYNYEYC